MAQPITVPGLLAHHQSCSAATYWVIQIVKVFLVAVNRQTMAPAPWSSEPALLQMRSSIYEHALPSSFTFYLGCRIYFFFYVIDSLDGLSFAFLSYLKLYAGPVGMKLLFSPHYESFDGCFW